MTPPPASRTTKSTRRTTKSNGATMSESTASPVPHDVSVLDLDRLVDGWHHDPHSILGPHVEDGVVTIRVLRPAAESVTIMRTASTGLAPR